MKTYRLIPDNEHGRTGKILVSDGMMEAELNPEPSQKVWNHSPTGFAWGYAGSGPAQSALAILLDYTGDAEIASRLHQRFKFEKIATMPDGGGKIPELELKAWLEAQAKQTVPAEL